MRGTHAPRRARTIGVAAVALSMSAVACGDSLLGLDDDGAQSVRIALSVDGSQTALPIEYLVSNNFGFEPLQDRVRVLLNTADTATASIPFDQRFETGGQRQLVFLVTDRSEVSEPIRLRLWLDDEFRFEASFQGGEEEPVQVIYVFGSGLIAQDLEII